MIIGIGCDIVSHNNIEKRNWCNDEKIRSRLFSIEELKLLPLNLKQQISFLAGRFAVKEAVLKCLGTGIVDGISLIEIETLTDKFKKPILVLSGEVQRISLEKGISNWHVTLTHSDVYSIALVIAERIQ